MAVLYRCDVCREVHAEGAVPDSWRTIAITTKNYDGDNDDKEEYLVCTACVTSFNGFIRERQAGKVHFLGETGTEEAVKKTIKKAMLRPRRI